MSVGRALRAALVDGYQHSLKLLVLNVGLSVAVVAILLAASYVQAALLLIVLVGPLAAALMHCTLTLVRTEDLHLSEALTGLRLHWRRGLQLALLAIAGIWLGIFAVRFYARAGTFAWPLAILAGYLLVLFGVLQLVLWPLAVDQRERSLRAILGEAAMILIRRPGAHLGLGLALLLVNAILAIAILPPLTLTVAYSFLAAAHFARPRQVIQEVETAWRR
ncbi:MAG: hypothetical protein ACRDGU_09075 [Actinomycetota bacterium]